MTDSIIPVNPEIIMKTQDQQGLSDLIKPRLRIKFP